MTSFERWRVPSKPSTKSYRHTSRKTSFTNCAKPFTSRPNSSVRSISSISTRCGPMKEKLSNNKSINSNKLITPLSIKFINFSRIVTDTLLLWNFVLGSPLPPLLKSKPQSLKLEPLTSCTKSLIFWHIAIEEAFSTQTSNSKISFSTAKNKMLSKLLTLASPEFSESKISLNRAKKKYSFHY